MSDQQTDPKLREEILNNTVKRYIEVEEETIASCLALQTQVKGFLARQMMEMIRWDSQKHLSILLTIKQIQEGVITLTQEELGEVDALMDKHIQIEQESMILARAGMENSKNPIVQRLFEHLLEDERRHVTMSENLVETKKNVI